VRGHATSPLPPSALTEIGDSAQDAQKKIDAMQEQQAVMLARLKKMLAALPPTDPKQANKADAREREDKRRQLIKLLAEIERRINEENARPKKRYISPSTREEVYAVYYDSLRRKIEDRGTRNFPEVAGKKLYGELTMIVTVNYDGKVLDTEVAQTSGSLALDRRAATIARTSGPFGRFSDAMRRKADQIVVVSRFKFTRDETLETKLTDR
jgi:protein TonB